MPSPDSAVPFDALVSQLCEVYPGVLRAHVETLVFDEHELLGAGEVGDLVPGIVVGAVTERLAREVGMPYFEDGAEAAG